MGHEWGIRECRWQNISVLALIVAAHVLLLRVEWLSKIRTSGTDSVLSPHLLTLSLPVLQPVIEKPVRLDKPRGPKTESITPSTLTAPQATVITATRPDMDWRTASAQTVAELARRGSKDPYRSLDSRPALKETPPADDVQNGIFPPPLHKAGETQRLDNGEIIYWLNDRCFWTSRPPTSANERNVGKACKRLSKTARSDLFEQFKPDYLRTPVEESPIPDMQ